MSRSATDSKSLSTPRLFKAKRVDGLNLYLRNITDTDAEFVFKLRTRSLSRKYLSPSVLHVDDQRAWIRKYQQSDDQAYFIVCDKKDARLGCVRLYDTVGSTYFWGSWLLVKGVGPLVAIESVILVYAYAKRLGFNEARIDVRRDNTSVWRFHERFCEASLIKEDAVNRQYILSSANIDKLLHRYRHLLPDPFTVEFEPIVCGTGSQEDNAEEGRRNSVE